MTTFARRTRVLVAALVLAMSAAACGDSGDGEADSATSGSDVDTSEQIDVTFGSTNAQSSAFALFTTHARLSGQADGNLNVNVRETAASTENIQLVNDHDVELGISSWELLYQAREGLGNYQGKPHEDLMPIFTYLRTAEFMLARASGVPAQPSVSDLAGKAVAPSSQGASTYAKWAKILDILDVNIKTFDGSLEDVVNAMKDGRITAFGKSANALGPDASMLDVASSVDVVPVTLTDEQVAKVEAEVPYYSFTKVPPGAMKGWPQFQTPVITAVYFVHRDLAEDHVYRLTKALVETLEKAAQNAGYAASQGIDPKLTMETHGQLPLHPGALRYFKEIGAA